jgi:hypothetical protein
MGMPKEGEFLNYFLACFCQYFGEDYNGFTGGFSAPIACCLGDSTSGRITVGTYVQANVRG